MDTLFLGAMVVVGGLCFGIGYMCGDSSRLQEARHCYQVVSQGARTEQCDFVLGRQKKN